MHKVSLVKYEKPLESMRRALELCGGLGRIPVGAKVFLKPNIVYWTKATPFPKWGVITTSRVVADVVELLAEHGVTDLTIGEGMVQGRPGDKETPAHAFATLGYQELARRFGVKVVNTFERPFEEVDLGEGMKLAYNVDALHSDLVVTLPVMKTHAQTVVSLGIKNLKGLLDVNSRKRCHSADPSRDLHQWVARLAEPLPSVLAVIDGIYTAERGPGFDGVMHRADLLCASWDALSADLVGARLLGQDPAQAPHLAQAAARAGRPLDLSDVETAGLQVDDVARPHQWTFPYNDECTLPLPMTEKGISGVRCYKYDSSMCTYCSGLNGVVLTAMAWQGRPWDEVEVLTGKMMHPRGDAKSTILLGKCMYQAHRDNPAIRRMLAVKGCPPDPMKMAEVLHQAGIMVDPDIFRGMDRLPGMYLKRYQGRPEFDEALFQVA